MGFFGVWCAKCAKYLAFGSSVVNALKIFIDKLQDHIILVANTLGNTF